MVVVSVFGLIKPCLFLEQGLSGPKITNRTGPCGVYCIVTHYCRSDFNTIIVVVATIPAFHHGHRAFPGRIGHILHSGTVGRTPNPPPVNSETALNPPYRAQGVLDFFVGRLCAFGKQCFRGIHDAWNGLAQ